MSEDSTENLFSRLSDDVVLKILFKMEDDPRNWSRLACVCTKFSSMIRTICWKTKCNQTIPSVISDLLQIQSSTPPGGWASLHKLAVCCPGLLHSGVLLEHSDLGLERDLGPDENFHQTNLFQPGGKCKSVSNPSCSSRITGDDEVKSSDCSWSLYDDLYFDSAYGNVTNSYQSDEICEEGTEEAVNKGIVAVCKRRKNCRSSRSHLASGAWNLSREQGNKLLASRFRGDCLYICDWPGCVHIEEEKRNYMLFRGVFKDFKRSRVWRTIKDGNRSTIELNCAYCCMSQVYDLHAAFCLRPAYGFHDDGEPVVRAYVCENGHVSGAWTDWPLYT